MKMKWINKLLDEPVLLIIDREGIIKYCSTGGKEDYNDLIKGINLPEQVYGKKSVLITHSQYVILCEEAYMDSKPFYVVTIKGKKEGIKRHWEIAYKDCLTGVYNRSFWEQIRKGNIILNRDSLYSAIMINMENLSALDRHYGHDCADNAVKAATDIMTGCVRKEDIIVRYKEDIFLLILSCQHKMDVERIISRIKKGLAKKYEQNQADNIINVSYTSFSTYEDLAGLVKATDRSLLRKYTKANLREADQEANREADQEAELTALKELIDSIKSLMNRLLEHEQDRASAEIILKISRVLDKLLIMYIEKIDSLIEAD